MSSAARCTRRLAIGLLAVVAIPAGAASRFERDGQLLRCESRDGRPRECAADARGGARLLRQLSRSACIEGETWGTRRRAVWVSHGCRGEFLVAGGYGGRRSAQEPGAHQGYFRCESDNGRWNHCEVSTRRGVQLVRQLSRSACIRGQSWGVDSRGVWVAGGCRAEFRLRGHDLPPATSRVRCESMDGDTRTCRLDGHGDARLLRQLSRSPCIEGHSWDRVPGGVRVAHGCRAEFESLPAIAGRD